MVATCVQCEGGPVGERGHAGLEFNLEGPYPGHHIFHCHDCGQRWIRHHGCIERYGWTNYARQFGGAPRRPVAVAGRAPARAAAR